MKKELRIKAWAIVNKISGYPKWECGHYLIFLYRRWAKDKKFRVFKKEKNEKIVPCEVVLFKNKGNYAKIIK